MSNSGGTEAYPSLADYAIIGDGRSAALVSRTGSIDWLCWPRFDSPSVFGALLDARRGGCFWVRPTGSFEVSRRYRPDTAVLETTFVTPRGVARLLDLMPMAAEEHHEVLRIVECMEGEVELDVMCEPRPSYGRHGVRVIDRFGHALHLDGGDQTMILNADVPLAPLDGDGRVGWRGRLRRGERHDFSLSFVFDEPGRSRLLGAHAERRARDTERWWHEWVAGLTYDGEFRDAVVRSAITLRLLIYMPTGAVVAAPTTSLPEWPGGTRNWDYRLCWIRDTSLTVQALRDLGCHEELAAFVSWVVQTTSGEPRDLHVVYDVNGRPCDEERELTHLEGYRGSRPVRVGNAAGQQLQLDIYGEVVDAVHELVLGGHDLDRPTATLLVALGQTVCQRWQEPDEGIWEIRSGRRHHTYSKMMCWLVLDRLAHLHALGHLQLPIDEIVATRDEIRRCVEDQGYNGALRSYTTELGGDDVDASLLLMLRYGFHPPTHPRARSTFALVERRLSAGPLLYRYRDFDDGIDEEEGAFGTCGFWAVEVLAQQGEWQAATERFERLLAFGNDVGLFPEEIDPDTGTPLGNFPQAFTHVGLLDAALALRRAAAAGSRTDGAAQQPERHDHGRAAQERAPVSRKP
jgi:GH15 family glucan-1,4-alpha-glucosidase